MGLISGAFVSCQFPIVSGLSLALQPSKNCQTDDSIQLPCPHQSKGQILVEGLLNAFEVGLSVLQDLLVCVEKIPHVIAGIADAEEFGCLENCLILEKVRDSVFELLDASGLRHQVRIIRSQVSSIPLVWISYD